jgi:AcrR family transcriptional regulator
MEDKTSATAGCPPRKRDRDATTRALLDAARCVFAGTGYDAATTREIANRADANEALIQRYFGGKAGLLEAVLRDDHAVCPARGRGVESLAEAGLEAVIRSFFERSCGEKEDRQEFMRVVVSRAILDPSIAATMRERVCDIDQAVIRQQLEKLRELGKIRADADLQSSSLALASLAFSLGFFGRLVYRQPEADIQAAIAVVASSFARELQPAGGG